VQGSKLSFQDFVISWASTATHARIAPTAAERESVMDRQPTGPNPLNDRDDFSRPALRHGSLNSLFRCIGVRAQDFDFRVQGSGFRVQGVGFKVEP
jgi:hypothetical protein